VERIRIDLARRALLETETAVETIALDCGFGSLRRMDRAFARLIDATPSEFRARFKTRGSTQSGFKTQGENKWLSSTLVS